MQGTVGLSHPTDEKLGAGRGSAHLAKSTQATASPRRVQWDG